MIRGQVIYYNTGELSFETSPRTAGTYRAIFLERHGDYIRFINRQGRIEQSHKSLVSGFNI
jgi:hypothetical protein